MNTQNFINLIQGITSRDFSIDTNDLSLHYSKKYYVFRTLKSGRTVGFYWVTPKTDDKFLRSFITAFTTKYFEPNPKNYDGKYPGSTAWDNMTNDQRDFCYMHHRSNMISKKDLLSIVESNFNNNKITNILCRYGFYPTEYGIGIFCLFNTKYVTNSILKMVEFLNSNNIPFSNEFSDAKWVYRFKINLDKIKHEGLLDRFNLTVS